MAIGSVRTWLWYVGDGHGHCEALAPASGGVYRLRDGVTKEMLYTLMTWGTRPCVGWLPARESANG